MNLLIAVILAGAPLLLIELASRRLGLGPELSRKLVHVGSSLVIALMPLLVSLPAIAAISFGFLGLMLLLRRGRHWHAIYRVQRASWGELIFPLAVALTALLAPSVISFVTAILVLGLADTAAATVGGQVRGRRLPWSHDKTMAGMAACFSTTFIICGIMTLFGLGTWPLAVTAALLVSLAESLSPHGSDNLTMPLMVLAVMR